MLPMMDEIGLRDRAMLSGAGVCFGGRSDCGAQLRVGRAIPPPRGDSTPALIPTCCWPAAQCTDSRSVVPPVSRQRLTPSRPSRATFPTALGGLGCDRLRWLCDRTRRVVMLNAVKHPAVLASPQGVIPGFAPRSAGLLGMTLGWLTRSRRSCPMPADS